MEVLVRPPITQGDVILKKLENLPENAVLVQKDVKILQESEVTGHHHHFRTEGVDLYQLPEEITKQHVKTITPNLGKIIKLNAPAVLYHSQLIAKEAWQSHYFPDITYRVTRENHKPIEVPAGIYYIDIVREYDYDANEVVRVVD